MALVEPAGHMYPAVHSPLHVDAFMPGWFPKYPVPQLLHPVAPPVLYFPARHTLAFSGVVEGPGQEYPAGQGAHAPAPDALYWPAGQA